MLEEALKLIHELHLEPRDFLQADVDMGWMPFLTEMPVVYLHNVKFRFYWNRKS